MEYLRGSTITSTVTSVHFFLSATALVSMMVQHSCKVMSLAVFFRYDVIVLTLSDHKCCYYTNMCFHTCNGLHRLCSQVQVRFTKAKGKQNDITS